MELPISLLLGVAFYWPDFVCSEYKVPVKSPLLLPDANSPFYLKQLAEHEVLVQKVLLDIANNQAHLLPTKLLEQIQDYLLQYEHERGEQLITSDVLPANQAAIITENPLLTLSLIRRFSRDLTLIYGKIQLEMKSLNDETVSALSQFQSASANWPNATTLKDTILALFRIQMVYDLEAADLASGRISGVETAARLSTSMMFILGKYARKLRMYSLAVPWLELTRKSLASNEQKLEKTEFSIQEIESVLFETMIQHDMEWPDRESSLTHEYFYKKQLLDTELRPNRKRKTIRKGNISRVKKLGTKYNGMKSWSLCSGENHQSEQIKSRLVCWYDTNSDPALRIYPIKIEMLSKTPYIVQMYDVLSESTKLELANPRFQKNQRSQIVESSTRSSRDMHILGYHKFPKLSKFIELVTGLSVIPRSSSEVIRVQRYDPGSHYDCHLDAPNPNPNHAELSGGYGNPIATMMFYVWAELLAIYLINRSKFYITNEIEFLNDVMAGGGGFTAFPEIGVAARPIKGSALFWYNLEADGAIDYKTYHCACPVILGSKTVATKWIQYHDQFKRCPCPVRRKSKEFKIL